MKNNFTNSDGFMISEPSLQIKRLIPDAILPIRASSGSVGYDLFASEDLLILCNDRACISTGLSMIIPDGHYGRTAPRSGLAVKYGLQVGADVIDPDYRGEVKIVLFNHGKEAFQVKKGDKIAQLILEKVSVVDVIEVKELNETQRGEGGFGSSGMKYHKPDSEVNMVYFGPTEDAPINGGPGIRNEFVPWVIQTGTTTFGPSVTNDDYLFNKVDAKTKEAWERDKNSTFVFPWGRNCQKTVVGTCAMCNTCGANSSLTCKCHRQ
jgi:dUTP pyrophosphatase